MLRGLAACLREVEEVEGEIDALSRSAPTIAPVTQKNPALGDTERASLYSQMGLKDVGAFRTQFERKVRDIRGPGAPRELS